MIREGDIENLRNRAKLDGRPIKSNLIRDKKGSLVTFRINKQGHVRIVR